MNKLPVAIVFAGLIVSGCSESGSGNQRGGGPKGRPGPKPIPVELTQPETGTAFSHYVTTATLSANSDAKINSRTNGVIRHILHEEGDDVQKGDLLLQLEDDDQQLRVKQAKIRLASAEREYNRLNKMKDAGAVSANDWEASNNNYLNAKTELELADLALSYTKIKAPFTGRLVWRDVDLGAYVSNGELLFRMMSINPLLLRVYVPAKRVENITIDQKVKLRVDSISQELEGRISLVSPIVDPSTGTVKVTISLENYPTGVRPGDFTEVELVTNQRENALLIPSIALIEERGQNYLYVVEGDTASKRIVEVGFIQNYKTEIVSGIARTDKIVVKGQRNLNDGNKVKVLNNEKGIATAGDHDQHQGKEQGQDKRKPQRKEQ